ncbi:cupin domain-containing protein [Nakamurella leprariae]|uniref:Cupin domain-containing protein n=1 Tax=Nakamurella leprariae TaxID=2803911 RepID=A0A938YAV4_9ACTN|nr:cupin domain-containing protein [Nakamurella leprariae]MBM9467222.1 cupin domain-containing protein [Nakamurella leprariae]
MSVRRVVTGTVEGRSTVVSDGTPPRTDEITAVPGFVSSLVWATDPTSPSDHQDPTAAVTSFVPQPGGTRIIHLTLPPDSVYASPEFDPALSAQQQLAASPGLAELFEPDAPGFHTTPTTDYGVVLSGRVVLELDDGHTTELAPGDVVVQNGTRHAWRNPFAEPARAVFVLVGARQQ